MDPSAVSRFCQYWFNSFSATLNPRKNELKIEKTFFSYCGSQLRAGLAYLCDPNRNLSILFITARNGQLHFTSGVVNMAMFYSLKSEHTVVVHHLDQNFFEIRVFDMNKVEIDYPIKMGREKTPQDQVSRNFFKTFKTTLDPNKDTLDLSLDFNFFWKDVLKKGIVYIHDIEGNSSRVSMNKKANGIAYFSAGIRKLAVFYELRNEEHEVHLHCLGIDIFQIRIYTTSGIEIPYPKYRYVQLLRGEPAVNPLAMVDVMLDVPFYLHEENFFYMEKTLSSYDARCFSLYLEGDFSCRAFPRQRRLCTLEDEAGFQWSSELRWPKRGKRGCYLTSGWRKFSTAKGFKEGSVVRFVVSRQDETKIKVMIIEN